VVSRLFIRYSLRLRNEVTVELSSHNDSSDDQIMHVDSISGPSSLRMASGEKLKARDEEESGVEPQNSRDETTCALSNVRRTLAPYPLLAQSFPVCVTIYAHLGFMIFRLLDWDPGNRSSGIFNSREEE
jgi:hypothetical protein